MITKFEDRVVHALIHTSSSQRAPALNQVFNTAPRRGALESLGRLRERVAALDHPIQIWTEQWIVEHRVIERYLALMTEQEQTFARLQHADWLAELEPSRDHDHAQDAGRWAYITLSAISSKQTQRATR